MRVYTSSSQRKDEVDNDFALQEVEGLASICAKSTQVGNLILINGL